MAAIRTQREIRQRAPWWLFGLLALNFALMTYDARDDATKQRKIRSMAHAITYPIQQGTSSVGNWLGGFFGNFGELRRASTENQQLHQQIDQMQTELRDTRERATEADRLEKLFKLTEKSDYKTVVARVIARDPSMWFDSVTIDKGRWSGVEINMPVVIPREPSRVPPGVGIRRAFRRLGPGHARPCPHRRRESGRALPHGRADPGRRSPARRP